VFYPIIRSVEQNDSVQKLSIGSSNNGAMTM